MNQNQALLSQPPKGVNRYKFAFLVAKRYFETGYSITSYVKYVIALVGLSTLNMEKTLILAAVYIPVCFLVGWVWYRWDFAGAETEIGNRFNYFVREMREKIK